MRVLLLSAILLLPFPAQAAELRARLYSTDRDSAQAAFDESQKRACLDAFDKRYAAKFALSGELRFDDAVSRTVYDMLYWKGNGSLHRGVAYTAPVRDGEGEVSLICYYALTDHRLDFQDALVLPKPYAELASAK